MQFTYVVSHKLLASLSAEVLKEEQKEFSGADPLENRKAAFQFFQQKLYENTATAAPAPVNITPHSSKAIVVDLQVYKEENLLHTVTLYESTATERDLLEPAQKELGFYKQYAINLPGDSVNNTLLVIVPRFTSQIVQ